MKTNHSRMTFISTVTALATVLALLTFFTATDPVLGQEATNVTEGKITYRPVVKNGRILWFESRAQNETVDRVSLFLYDGGESKLISNDVSVLFPGWPDLDDNGSVAYMKNMGRGHEVFLYDDVTRKEIQITNNPAIRNSSIDMGLGSAKVYTGYVRINGGDIVFKNRLGEIFLYQHGPKSIRRITTTAAQTANLGDDDQEKGSTGVAVPWNAHVKYFEFDGKHIVWMNEKRGSDNNSKVSIYMAKAADKFVPKLITSFDAWVPNDKALLAGKVWNPFFRACNGNIVWQYYLPSKPPKLPGGGILPNLKKDYGANMDDVHVGFYDGKAASEVSSGTAVTFQSVRIVNGKVAWSQIRKEGEGKDEKKFNEVILYGTGANPIVASYPERPKQGKLKEKYWDRIEDVEIVGEQAFWVMEQVECFQQFKMPVTNELYCMYQPTSNIGFFHQRTGNANPFKTMTRQSFAGGGELDRGLYAFFRKDIENPFNWNGDISAVNIVGSGGQSDNFITVADLKTPDQKKLPADKKDVKHISDAFSITFDFIPGCSEAVGLDEITLESITLDVSAEKSPTARLEEIKSVALYSDENKNGELDASDKLLGRRNGPVPAETIFTFSGDGIKVERKEPRHFLVEMEIVDDVCPCGNYTVEISGQKLGIKNQPGLGAVSASGKTTGSLIMPEAKIKQIRGDEQAGLPNQKLPETLAVVFENFPVRCGKVKFKITTQPFEKGAIIFSSNGEKTDEVILDLIQVGKDAAAEIGFQLGKQDGLYKVTASIVPADGEVCDNEEYVFQEHAGKMVVQLIDLNNPDYYTAVADTSNPEFDTWRATMTADIDKLARGGDGRTGALADGASMLLIRAQLIGFTEPPSGDVKFNIAGSGNIGHLTRGLGEEIPEYNGGPAFTTRWVKTKGGIFAFALYTPPANFGYSTAPTSSRKVALDVAYQLPNAPAPFEHKQDLTLEKPPVALIHGLWSGPSTWGPEFTSNSRGYEIHLVDYSHLNSRSFSQLSGELHAVIIEMKRKLRLRKIAATRVNVVGHSMGGLVTRQLVADNHGLKHFRKDNFGRGEIYKFMTIGTPHFGSPLAWLGVNARGALALLIEKAGASDMINGGAVTAMCPGSQDLQALGPTNVPTNTVRAWNLDSRSQVPTEFDEIMSDVLKNPGKLGKPTPAGLSFAMLRYAATATGSVGLSRFYSADKTDILVTVFSQSGGIAQGANNVFDKTLHFDLGFDLAPNLYYETTSAAVAAHVFDTLNRDYDDINYFARRLPAPQVQDDFINCTARK